MKGKGRLAYEVSARLDFPKARQIASSGDLIFGRSLVNRLLFLSGDLLANFDLFFYCLCRAVCLYEGFSCAEKTIW